MSVGITGCHMTGCHRCTGTTSIYFIFICVSFLFYNVIFLAGTYPLGRPGGFFLGGIFLGGIFRFSSLFFSL